MSTDELERVLEALNQRRAAFNDTVFVLVLERERSGEMKLLDYGLRDIGDLAAWIAVQREKQNQPTEGERA
ncbi:hypothetical protein [Anaerolinea sp.]|uniref:hypothetical protein n=1 Tax=Anaerolinea sp. TaxID=1872519 RepID=UPI002ACD7AD4|nr:hypothetical protein [Anaerolinea sp.]